MNKCQKFIEYSASLPFSTVDIYRGLKKEKHVFKSCLSYKIFNWGIPDFIIFYEDVILLRIYKKDKQEYPELIYDTQKRLWEEDTDTSNWYEIPIYKINKDNENLIFCLIKKSYDNVYNKYKKEYHYDFFKKVFNEKLNKEDILDWAIEYKQADKYRYIFEKTKKKSVMLVENINQKVTKGSSKLGGQPDLPKDFLWPTCDNKPLTFLAQIDLSEINPNMSDRLLPNKGFLYFFSAVAHLDYDDYIYFLDKIDEKGTNKVYYFDVEKSDLKRQNNYYFKLNEVAINIDYADSYPLYKEEKILEQFNLTSEEIELFTDVSDLQHMATYSHITLNYTSMHSLLAYEIPIQELGSDDRVLLQTMCSENTGMDWGDSGAFCFYINEDDLKIRNFENITAGTQCG